MLAGFYGNQTLSRRVTPSSDTLQVVVESMMKSARICAAAVFGLLAFGTVSAEAASPISPLAAPAPVTSAPVEQAAWVCGRARCNWVPGPPRGPVPPWARGWGPPPRPGCYWTRQPRPYGPPRWVQVCRRW